MSSSLRVRGGPARGDAPGGGEPAARRPALVVALLVAATMASRLPFLPGTGLGIDPDSWRLALAGRVLARTGHVALSRRPGYPLVELVAAVLDRAPQVALTTATAAIGAAGVGVLALLCRRLGVRHWWLPAAGMAATNAVYRNSTSFMDYTWSTSLLLGSLLAVAGPAPAGSGVAERAPVSTARAGASGALFGLAVAARPSTGAAGVVAAVVVLLCPAWTLRRAATAALAAAGSAGALFAAPLLRYGPSMITVHRTPTAATVAVERATVGVWGLWGLLGVAVGAVLAMGVVPRWVRAARAARGGREPAAGPASTRSSATTAARRTWVVALSIGLVVQVALFRGLPLDPGYLLPAVAMTWVLFGIALRSDALGVVVALVLAGALVPAPSFVRTLGAPSTVSAEASRRREQVRTAPLLLAAVRRQPPGTEVALEGSLPELVLLSGAPVPPSTDPAGLGARVRLPTGQVLTHGRGVHLPSPG